MSIESTIGIAIVVVVVAYLIWKKRAKSRTSGSPKTPGGGTTRPK